MQKHNNIKDELLKSIDDSFESMHKRVEELITNLSLLDADFRELHQVVKDCVDLIDVDPVTPPPFNGFISKDEVPVNNTIAPENEVGSSSSAEEKDIITEIANEDKKPISVFYSSVVTGNGFDFGDLSIELGLRSLYAIEVMDEQNALYYPLADKVSRFKNNPNFLTSMCEVSTPPEEWKTEDLELINIKKGILRSEKGSRWILVKPCFIN